MTQSLYRSTGGFGGHSIERIPVEIEPEKPAWWLPNSVPCNRNDCEQTCVALHEGRSGVYQLWQCKHASWTEWSG